MMGEDWKPIFAAVRARYEAEQRREREPVPPPEHTSGDLWPDGFPVPLGARTMLGAAEARGWTGRVQYARGYVESRRKNVDTGKMDRLIERRHSVAVILRHDDRNLRAFAVWESPTDASKQAWKITKSVRVWKVGEMPRKVTVTELVELL